MTQTIAIIGAGGKMGSSIARNLAKAGHHILLAGPTKSRLTDLLVRIRQDSPAAEVEILDCSHEASWEADVIIPAVPYAVLPEIAGRIRDVVTGKIVVSVANPLNATFDGLLTEPTTSSAEEMAALLPHSRTVKAFNTVFAGDFDHPVSAGKTIDCFVAGDDAPAVATVLQLVRDAGFNPVFAGNLTISRTLESMTALLIGLSVRNKYEGPLGWKVLHQGV